MGIVIYSMCRFFVHYKNNIAKNVAADPCADPESFVRGGPTLTAFFYEKKEDQNTTKIGPSSARR